MERLGALVPELQVELEAQRIATKRAESKAAPLEVTRLKPAMAPSSSLHCQVGQLCYRFLKPTLPLCAGEGGRVL